MNRNYTLLSLLALISNINGSTNYTYNQIKDPCSKLVSGVWKADSNVAGLVEVSPAHGYTLAYDLTLNGGSLSGYYCQFLTTGDWNV